mmetsp:Transcript_20411/g.46120  ORF Transcript_20411/g.46120 Transcript_20411/m.46120 type:complete len:442 (-) Transcript_20411:141-1466(-)
MVKKDDSHIFLLEIYGVGCFAIAAAAYFIKRFLNDRTKFRKFRSRAQVFIDLAELVTLTAVWFGLAVSVTLFNKWFYSYFRGGFDLPVSSTACHMVVKAMLAHVLVTWKRSPLREEAFPLGPGDVLLVVAIGFSTAGDIVLSNVSFLYITVTMYTVLKSSTVIWILCWAIALKLERYDVRVGAVVAAVAGGLALASWGDTAFSLTGILLVLGASSLGGLRWALSQRLMNAGPLRDFTMPPLVLIAKIAPFSALATILAAGLTEGPRLARLHRSGWEGPRGYEASEGDSGEAGGWDMVGQVLVFVLAGGVATFVLLLTETQLLEKTSSLTLGVLGTFKELLQIVLAILVFHDPVSFVNLLGLGLCLLGTIGYHYVKAASQAVRGRFTEFDPVRIADVELSGFLDDELSDGWDETPDTLPESPDPRTSESPSLQVRKSLNPAE